MTLVEKGMEQQPPNNEYVVINDVTAACRSEDCDWKANASLEVEIHSGTTVTSSEIFKLCLEHHDAMRASKGYISFHNQFFLLQNGEEVGFASVSSAGSGGMYNPTIDQKIRK